MQEKKENIRVKVKITYREKEHIVNISCPREISYDKFMSLCYTHSRSQCKLFLDITATDFVEITQLTHSGKLIERAQKFLDLNNIHNQAPFALESRVNNYRSDAYFYGQGFSFCATSRPAAFRVSFWDIGNFAKGSYRIQQPIICFDIAADNTIQVVSEIEQYFRRIELNINDLNLVVNKLTPPEYPMLNSACKGEKELLGVLMWLLAKKILERDSSIFDITFDLEPEQLFEKIVFFYKRIEKPCRGLTIEFYKLENELAHNSKRSNILIPFSFFPNPVQQLSAGISEHQLLIEADGELTSSSCMQA